MEGRQSRGGKRKLTFPPPNPKQEMFLTDKHKYIAFGGARGGGKSWAVRVKAVMLALSWPGIKVLIVRRTYRELVNNHIDYLQQTLAGIARYNKSDKVFVFPNGSKISFGYCADDGDLGQYQGAEYDVIFLDEATQLREEWIKKLRACLRGVNDFPKRMYMTCNPGGIGHAYIKRLFIDRKFTEGENGEEYSFIQSLVTDNKALMSSQPDYIRQLQALPPKLRDAWLYGRWDIFEGQYFEEFRTEPDGQKAQQLGVSVDQLRQSRRWTHVIDPFTPPPDWKIYRSYDWGYGKPFSCGWWAVDGEDTAYRILELYGCTKTPNEGVKWTNDRQFQQIAKVEREHPWLAGRKIYGVADPSIWDGSKGVSAADTAERYGVFFEPGINDRIPGWMQIRYRMQFDRNGYAKMYIFDTCQAAIRTIPLMMYDEHIPEDLDSDLEDHVCDEIRYFCMTRPIGPRGGDGEETAPEFDPLEQFRRPGRAVWL